MGISPNGIPGCTGDKLGPPGGWRSGDFCSVWGVPEPCLEVSSAGIGSAQASSILGNVFGLKLG